MLLVDTADPTLLTDYMKLPYVQGFTTNPSLMAKAAKCEALELPEYIERARALCRISKSADGSNEHTLMIQGVGSADQICNQAELYLAEIQRERVKARLWIKLMPTQEAMESISPLKRLECKTLVTAVYTATQALAAMNAGADGIALYLGRLIQFEKLWRERVERIRGVLMRAERMLLLASFPDIETVETALEFSTDLTVPPNLLADMLRSAYTEEAAQSFASKVTLG